MTATIVVFLFCLLYTVAIAAQSGTDARSANVANAKAEVRKLGFGKRVAIKLLNGTKTRGRITGLAEDDFTVTDSKGALLRVAYSEVSSISKQKEKLGIFDKPWTGIMFTAAGVGTLAVIAMDIFN